MDESGPARIFLRPLGSPIPFAFIGLFVATTMVAAEELGWFEPEESLTVALALLAFAAPLQFTAALYAFFARDSAAAASVGVIGVSWLVVGLQTLIEPAATSDSLGVFLVTVSIALLATAFAVAETKALAAIVVGATAVRFLVTGIFQLTAAGGVQDAAGVFGLALGGLALYAALAFELEDTKHAAKLPVLRPAGAREVIEGRLRDQVEQVENEAGVRAKL